MSRTSDVENPEAGSVKTASRIGVGCGAGDGANCGTTERCGRGSHEEPEPPQPASPWASTRRPIPVKHASLSYHDVASLGFDVAARARTRCQGHSQTRDRSSRPSTLRYDAEVAESASDDLDVQSRVVVNRHVSAAALVSIFACPDRSDTGIQPWHAVETIFVGARVLVEVEAL